jgi:signal transduction histidine kinase
MRPSVRQFGILVAAAVPPIIFLGLLLVVGEGWVESAGMGTTLLIGIGLAVGWAVVVVIVAGGGMSSDLRAVVEMTERGNAGSATADGGSSADAQRRAAMALSERNRQIGALAAGIAATSMTATPADVAGEVVATARTVTRDPTWQLAVLHVADPGVLAAGVYDDHSPPNPGPLRDLHAWAAVAETETPDHQRGRTRHLVGPWGAMVAVDASADPHVRALLLAPWAGRADPTPAEMDLLSLVGRHAATAIEHAVLYARLREQADELNRMAVIQSDFLRGITHDLQTPLTSIGAAAAALAAGPGIDAAGRTDLETIAHQADRLRRMVGQLLVASRLEAGAFVPRQEVFRIEPLVQRTWAALRDPTHTLTVRASGPAHLAVGDPDRLEQVLWAVFDNAVKYAPEAPEVTVDVDARAVDGGELETTIRVTDRGPGMDPEVAAHAFDQFFRADGARAAVPDGSGVGLYAARGLVEAMHGNISITSGSGEGTTIRITLPAESVDPADEDAAP